MGIIRTLWTPGPDVRFEGTYYRLDGAKPGPAPAHDIGIWLGAYQRRLLRLVGRVADGWVVSSPYLPPQQIPVANEIIDEAALAAGRMPEAVRRAYNVDLRGPLKAWVEQLTELTLGEGISVYILFRVESADTIRQFADEVAPAVRAAVAAERTRRNPAAG